MHTVSQSKTNIWKHSLSKNYLYSYSSRQP